MAADARTVMAFLGAAAFSSAVPAQTCEQRWLPGSGPGGVSDPVRCIEWDPDGPGPLPMHLVVGGLFTLAGDVRALNVAIWDGTGFRPMGDGLTEGFTTWDPNLVDASVVHAFAVLPTGELVAAGNITASGSTALNNIARWDGQAWEPLGAGLGEGHNCVYALAVLPNGHLLAGGNFDHSGSTYVGGLAEWDGTQWSRFTPMAQSSVTCIAVEPNGNVAIAKSISGPVSQWNGAQWNSLSGLSGPDVRTLRVVNGELMAGTIGRGGAAYVLRRIGSSWVRVGWDGTSTAGFFTAGSPFPLINSIVSLPDGSILAAGAFSRVGSTDIANFARWDGSTWHPVVWQPVGGRVTDLCVRVDQTLVALGRLYGLNESDPGGLAVWDGADWRALCPGMRPLIRSFLPLPDGAVIAAGTFLRTPQGPMKRIARWDGREWSALGEGLGHLPDSLFRSEIYSLLREPNGDIYAAGNMLSTTGAREPSVRRWDGTNWNVVGDDLTSAVRSIAQIPGGPLVAATGASVRSWDGSLWNQFGIAQGSGATVPALAVMPNATLIAAGQFSSMSGVPAQNIARWDGSFWTPIASGRPSQVYALLVEPDGTLIAAGGSNIGRWDGSAWNEFGDVSMDIRGLARLRDGRLLATGRIYTPNTASGAWMWDGSTWTPMEGIAGNRLAEDYAVAVLESGEAVFGGLFETAGNELSTYFARWTTDSVPWVSRHPVPAGTSCGQGAIFAIAPASGYEVLAFSWEAEDPGAGWIEIVDGPLVIAGQTIATAAGSASDQLTLTPVVDQATVRLRGRVANSCGSSPSLAATWTINPCDPPCDPDVNCDGAVNGFDIQATEEAVNGNFSNFCQASADLNGDGAENGFDVETQEQRVNGAPC